MSEISDDGTVKFLPDKLNRDPIVLRGMTNDEMFIVAGIGAALGLVLGLVGWLISGYVAMVVTVLVLVCAAVIYFGSAILRRMKRGKPETWLYRRIQWQVARFGLSIGSGHITVRSGFWSVRRERALKAQEPQEDQGKKQ
jgi:conjugative transfer region protein (TIGR03750 family)